MKSPNEFSHKLVWVDYARELEYEIKELKECLDLSHNRGLTSEAHNNRVKQALKK